METFSQSHKKLQVFCADFWPSADDCSLILADVGIDSARINLSEPSIMRWLSIIRELMRRNDGSMGVLVVVLMKQYPDNKALRDVCSPWIPATPAKDTSDAVPAGTVPVPAGAVLVKKFEDEASPDPKSNPKPDPKTKLVPVVTPVDFAEEAELVVPRIDTLWAAMVDMEQRMVEMEQWRKALSISKPAKKNG